MKKLFLLSTIVPCLASYFHLYNVLSWYRCRVYNRSGSYGGGSTGGIQCSSNNVVVLSISSSTSTSTSTTTTTTTPSTTTSALRSGGGSIVKSNDINGIPDVPPSIAYLTTKLMGGLNLQLYGFGGGRRDRRTTTTTTSSSSRGRSRRQNRDRRRKMLAENGPAEGNISDLRTTLDYSGRTSRNDSTAWSIFSTSSLSSDKPRHVEDVVVKDDTNNERNKYGFRTNQQKTPRYTRIGKSSTPWPVVPLATIFWLAVNIGLYVFYFMYKTNPSSVALNKQLLSDTDIDNNNSNEVTDSSTSTSTYSDFGRSLTGNTSHFEIWHVGFNMMALHSLGPMLERIYGSIPLLLYTASFLPITTMVVVLLWTTSRRLAVRRNGNTDSNNQQQQQQFPNMVGFSGILFAWMVVATLQNTNQSSCPIPFLPNLCFNTYTMTLVGGKSVHVNLAPLVQLVFLQVVLPRVSFFGHLAGVIVGFAWKWNLIPTLEYCQPSIAYPILWALGKYILGKQQPTLLHLEETSSSANSGGFGAGSNSGSSGYRLGGGNGGSSGNPWRKNYRSSRNGGQDSSSTSTSSKAISLLKLTRSFLVGHVLLLISVMTKAKARLVWPAITGSVVLSQAIMMALLTITIQSYNRCNGSESGGGNSSNLTLLRFGTVGRGYVVFILVTWITDAMTLGGWIATRTLWQVDHGLQIWWISLMFVWFLRLISWSIILGMVCRLLTVENEKLNRGIWFHTLSWSVVEPSNLFGRAVIETTSKWRIFDYNADQSMLSLSSSISPNLTTTRGSSPRRRNVAQIGHEITTKNDEEGQLVSEVV